MAVADHFQPCWALLLCQAQRRSATPHRKIADGLGNPSLRPSRPSRAERCWDIQTPSHWQSQASVKFMRLYWIYWILMNLDCPSPRTSRTSWIQQSVFVSFPTRHNLLWAWWCCCLLHYDLGMARYGKDAQALQAWSFEFLTESWQLALVQMEKKVEEWEAEEAELKLAEFEAELCRKYMSCTLHTTFETCWNMLKHAGAGLCSWNHSIWSCQSLPVTASHCQSTSSRLGAQRKRANTRTASRAWKLKSPGALATCSVLADLAQTCLAEIPRLGKEINQI